MKNIATYCTHQPEVNATATRHGAFLGCSSNSKNPSLLILIENWCVKTNSTPVVHIKIAGLKWMFIPLKMVLIDIDHY